MKQNIDEGRRNFLRMGIVTIAGLVGLNSLIPKVDAKSYKELLENRPKDSILHLSEFDYSYATRYIKDKPYFDKVDDTVTFFYCGDSGSISTCSDRRFLKYIEFVPRRKPLNEKILWPDEFLEKMYNAMDKDAWVECPRTGWKKLNEYDRRVTFYNQWGGISETEGIKITYSPVETSLTDFSDFFSCGQNLSGVPSWPGAEKGTEIRLVANKKDKTLDFVVFDSRSIWYECSMNLYKIRDNVIYYNTGPGGELEMKMCNPFEKPKSGNFTWMEEFYWIENPNHWEILSEPVDWLDLAGERFKNAIDMVASRDGIDIEGYFSKLEEIETPEPTFTSPIETKQTPTGKEVGEKPAKVEKSPGFGVISGGAAVLAAGGAWKLYKKLKNK